VTLNNPVETTHDKPGFPRLWLFVLLVLGSLILGDLNARMADARGLEQDAAILESEVTQLRDEITGLQDKIASANSEFAVEQWAHDQAKLVREGEHLVILVPMEQIEPAENPSSVQQIEAPSTLDVWLELLFGD
jgi:cell division protein FtsB